MAIVHVVIQVREFYRVVVSIFKAMMSDMDNLGFAAIRYGSLGLAALTVVGCTGSENVAPPLMSTMHETVRWLLVDYIVVQHSVRLLVLRVVDLGQPVIYADVQVCVLNSRPSVIHQEWGWGGFRVCNVCPPPPSLLLRSTGCIPVFWAHVRYAVVWCTLCVCGLPSPRNHIAL